jgi:hypothetical protein
MMAVGSQKTMFVILIISLQAGIIAFLLESLLGAVDALMIAVSAVVMGSDDYIQRAMCLIRSWV